ncbi:uncharacterized protein LOC128745465 [Sabethes cyaneus]|uniref:uncharacterized protein LOC128745465 n=1 Tax=Sabethes cyaneus TaxID=53552 RepID=UPI00237D8D94|nr:uncharacterized protein LOC128745465 [Sabethes cyaneus]
MTLGRSVVGIMDAPDPPTVVALLPPALISRPGPTCERGERGFQNSLHGKYTFVNTLASTDPYRVSSTTHLHDPLAVLTERNFADDTPTAGLRIFHRNDHDFSLSPGPGRLPQRDMETPDPPSSVEPAVDTELQSQSTRSCHPSRPGPESSGGEEVFQAAFHGKYPISNGIHCSDASSIPRTSTVTNIAASATTYVLVYYQNVGGMNSSLAEYQLAFSDCCYDVYALTETWLNQNTTTSQLFNDSYSVYRQDRSRSNSCKSTGGGVLLAVRSGFKSCAVNPPNSSVVEQFWVAITTVDGILYLCVVYIPPDRVNDENLMGNHFEAINWVVLQLKPRDKIVILGDFNLSAISWQRNSHGSLFPIASRSSIGTAPRKLLDTYSTAGLKQMNGIENENHRTLDLCFVSDELCVDCTVTEAPVPLVKICRHHSPLLTQLKIRPQQRFRDTSESLSYEFSKTNFNGMNDFLGHVDWEEVLRDHDASLAASTISSILAYAIDQFVPVKSKRVPPKPAWANADLKRLKTIKRAALRRHSKYRTDATRIRYVEINTTYKQLNDHLYNAHQNNLQRRLKANPKSFWRYVNEQRKESGLPSTMSNGLLEADSAADIADLFRSHFNNVFTNEHLEPQDVAVAIENVPRLSVPLSQFVISLDMVTSAGKRLKSSTGYGPDGIPSIILKRCMETLAAPLAAVFNLSLATGIFPNCWKQSYVFSCL